MKTWCMKCRTRHLVTTPHDHELVKLLHFQLAQRIYRLTDARVGTITRVATSAPDVVRVRWGVNDEFEFGDGDESINVKKIAVVPDVQPRHAAYGAFQLLRWAGGWINEGDNHGRECRFATRGDAVAWAAYENVHNFDGEAQFAVIELPLPKETP